MMEEVYLALFNALYAQQMNVVNRVDIAITQERFEQYNGSKHTSDDGVELAYAVVNIGLNATRDLHIDVSGITGTFRINGRVHQIDIAHKDILGFIIQTENDLTGIVSPRYLMHSLPTTDNKWVGVPFSLLSDETVKDSTPVPTTDKVNTESKRKPNPFKLVK